MLFIEDFVEALPFFWSKAILALWFLLFFSTWEQWNAHPIFFRFFGETKFIGEELAVLLGNFVEK